MPLRSYLRQLRRLDWLMMGAVVLLLSFSFAALYGIGASLDPPDFSLLRKHATFAALGVLALAFSFSVPTAWWRQYVLPLYGFGVLLLLGVLLFGQTRRGTTGWFGLGPLSFQPVELSKLTLLVMLAYLVDRRAAQSPASWAFVLRTGAATAVYILLVLLQPDFGSAALLALLWVGILAVVKVPTRQALLLGGIVLLVAAVAWNAVFQDYQRARVMTFLDPSTDPYGRGYQVRQAIIAVGAGRLWGRGLGFGSQSQLKFLPASQTDFIFAVIAEELGFVGVILVLAAYLVLLYRLVALAQRSADDFTATLTYGISLLLFCQVAVNIGMNVGLLPVTGIGLPLLSYGGSYLLATFLMLGMAQRVAASSIKYPG